MSWLLERLRKHKDDRGMMANLRCILVENKKHRAWPVLNRLGVPINDDVSAFMPDYLQLTRMRCPMETLATPAKPSSKGGGTIEAMTAS